MIHVKFSSPALMGQPVRMIVTQGRVSRSLSIDAFGMDKLPSPDPDPDIVPVPDPDPDTIPGGQTETPPPPVDTGKATLTLSARRGDQQIAPEGVAFFAEVSGFDAQKPTDGSVYDPTMHDIAYLWNFGDAGATHTAPQNMLSEWRDANTGYGPFPSHVFTKPGTYAVTCIATEKSSGKVASATLSFTVQDPEAVFTAATTVVCASSGNYAGAPAHDVANRTTTWPAAIARLKALKSLGQPCRLLFRGGDQFEMTANNYVGNAYHNLYVSSFGTGRATVKISSGSFAFQIWGSLPVSGASVSRLAFVGPWDSTTEARDPAYAATTNPGAVSIEGGFGTVHDCTATGCYTAFSNGSWSGLTAIFSNCQATNWEDYGLYVVGEKPVSPSDPLTGYVGVLGCRLHQAANALQGANGKSVTDRGNRHGTLRMHAQGYHYVDALDGFSRNGWGASAGVPVDQNIIRDHRNDPKSRAFFSRIMGEGGSQGYGNGAAIGEGHAASNTVIDKFLFMGSARTQNAIGISGTAVTVRNGIVHRPNVGTGAGTADSSITLADGQPVDFAAAALTEPVRVYNVTIVNEMDDTQQARNGQGATAWTPVDIRPGVYADGMAQVANIVVHRPNFTGGFVGDGPLNSARLGLVPRYLGYRWKNHAASSLGDKLVMDTSFATPADPWSLWRPAPGAKAIGSATGLVAHDDLLGNVRPPAASRGAVEPA